MKGFHWKWDTKRQNPVDITNAESTEGMRALDVGCGSGYLAAVMARMVGIEGQVVAIDYLSPLVALSLENVRKEDADLLDSVLAGLRV